MFTFIYLIVMVMTSTVLAFDVSDRITTATNVQFELIAEINRLQSLCTKCEDKTVPIELLKTVGLYFKEGEPEYQVDGMT